MSGGFGCRANGGCERRRTDAEGPGRPSALTISEAECKAYIWPKVSPSNGAKFEKFYSQYKQGSEAGLVDAVKQLGGQKWLLVKIEPGAVISQGRSFRVLSAPAVAVRTSDGVEKVIRQVGPILEQNGSFKVSTYYVTQRAETK